MLRRKERALLNKYGCVCYCDKCHAILDGNADATHFVD